MNTCRCGNLKGAIYQLCPQCNERKKADLATGVTTLPAFKPAIKKEFKETFGDGQFFYDGNYYRSKSELIIALFLKANNIRFEYEARLNLNKEFRPDFLIEDDRGNKIILEHFGLDNEGYLKSKEYKAAEYERLCKSDRTYFFITTDEIDIENLNERLGRKLDKTPLKRPRWK